MRICRRKIQKWLQLCARIKKWATKVDTLPANQSQGPIPSRESLICQVGFSNDAFNKASRSNTSLTTSFIINDNSSNSSQTRSFFVILSSRKETQNLLPPGSLETSNSCTLNYAHDSNTIWFRKCVQRYLLQSIQWVVQRSQIQSARLGNNDFRR